MSKRLLQPQNFIFFRSKCFSKVPAARNFVGKNGGEIIASSLKSLGVERVFGVPGTKLLSVLDFVRQANIDFVMARNEQGAAFMAEGYASGFKPERRPGVVLVSSGPGFSNTLTPVYDAFYQNLPLLVFSSQVPTHLKGRHGFQDTEAAKIAQYCTKWSTEVLDVASLPRIINEAYQISVSDRPGPVFIDVPEDILLGEFPKDPETFQGIFAPDNLLNDSVNWLQSAPSEPQMAALAEKINKSARPLFIVAHAPGLEGSVLDSLRHLAEKTEIPYVTTFLGWGNLDELNPRALHVFGTNGHVYANFAVQNSDCVVVIGEGLDDYFVGGSPGNKDFARAAQESAKTGIGGIFHLKNNIPSNRVQWFQATQTIDADYGQVFKLLLEYSKPPTEAHKKWTDQCQEWKRQYPMISEFDPKNSSISLKIEPVLTELSRQLDANGLKDKLHVVTGVGNHQISAYQYLKLPHPHRVTSSWIYCTMGFGMPAAIGVQLANKDSLVINIDGDGSFGMTAMELATAVDHNLPIKTLIVNNQGHGMMKQSQSEDFQAWYKKAEIKAPKSWAKLADVIGAQSLTLDNYENLEKAITWFLETDGPVVLEVMVDRNNYLSPEVPWGKPLDIMIDENGNEIPKPKFQE